ncbi:membrane bound O-acyl transferase family-domain-containing protein [Camillea tinctor]|nr:membrane bound O-acyl transferase family-domain-containing protein [Camillea tinctor]
MGQPGQHGVPLRTIYRQIYREKFWADVEAGVTKLFVVPLCFIGILILPALYLAIPHKDRPWLYRARWPLLAFLTAFHAHMIRSVSSMNFASAYGAGLIAAWGTIWNFALLVWTRPQWDAKRMHIRKRTRSETAGKHLNGHSTSQSALRVQSCDGTATANGHSQGAASKIPRKRQTHAKEAAAVVSDQPTNQPTSTTDLDQEYEYYWQEYPTDASFWTRLDWVLALITNVRMTGWNWAIPCLPPYEPPPYVDGTQLPLSSGIHKSRQGFTRELTRRQLLRSRFFGSIIPSYLVLDFCIVATSADPYFLLGPENHDRIPLPPPLASLPPLALSALRTGLSFFAILSALHLVWNVWALILAFPLRPLLGPLRSHPYHLPSMTGSFAQVLDRGLTGFWGAWWHQTFRFGFSAPALWLQRRGYLTSRLSTRLVGASLAFLQSGLVHAAASATTVAPSRWPMPLAFFLCAAAGTVLQAQLAAALHRPLVKHLPRPARRAGNFAFVLLWMWATSWMLVDDFGRCGLFLYDPLPVSVFRPLSPRIGGDPADTRVLRYDPGSAPTWVWVPGPWGWLQSGMAF